MNRFQLRRLALVSGLALLLAACGGGGADVTAGGGTGTLRLALTDAPACGYDKVNVTIDRIRVHQSASAAESDAGWSEIALSPAKRVDLLGLTNGVLAELGQTALPAGKYTQLRLVLAENGGATPLANSMLPTGAGAEVPLTTPSAQQSGLKLNTNIEVAANQMADFVIDFDACKSVVSAGNSGKYLLKPVLKVTPRYVSGVSGVVDASLANGGATLSLQQSGVAVQTTVTDAAGRFLLQPVAPGSYNLVLTAAGRTTLVVTGVPVTADTVSTISLSTAGLNPPVAATGTLAGTVTMAGTVDATVRATQMLVGGLTIEVAARPVDSATGAYSYRLPVTAPLVASFPTGMAALTFTPDTGAAGRYGLEARSGSSIKTASPVPLTAGASITTTFAFP
jgi:hypothetical protein